MHLFRRQDQRVTRLVMDFTVAYCRSAAPA
jgi:hypothetical protein